MSDAYETAARSEGWTIGKTIGDRGFEFYKFADGKMIDHFAAVTWGELCEYMDIQPAVTPETAPIASGEAGGGTSGHFAVSAGRLISRDGKPFVNVVTRNDTRSPEFYVDPADADEFTRRAVACVNACAGISTEALEAGVDWNGSNTAMANIGESSKPLSVLGMLTRDGLQAELRCSYRTIKRYELAGLPVHRRGNLRLYDPAEVVAFLRNERRSSGKRAAR